MRHMISKAAMLMTAIRLFGEVAYATSGILSSQVGYDIGCPMRAIVRGDCPDYLTAGATFQLCDRTGKEVAGGPVRNWGEKWGSFWWIADFSGIEKRGTYVLHVNDGDSTFLVSDPIDVGHKTLWSKCFRTIAFDFLVTRAEQARSGKGWRDCGSDLQELSSHVVAVDGLCDVLEVAGNLTTQDERRHLLNQVLTGCEYLAHLQDKAKWLGLGRGPVVHEDRQAHVVTGNVAKGAMIFARAGRLLRPTRPMKSAEYLERAELAFTWIARHGPIINEEKQQFYPHVHGSPLGSVPPENQWMTRDLVMMMRAAVELYKAGRKTYKQSAITYASRVMKRQVPREMNEGGLYGHFYTYDDFTSFGGIPFTEKANIHCGAWSNDGRIYNKGGHYPHYLIPMIEMVELWPDHPDAKRWRQTLRDFAYGYFAPACRQSPFMILPAGYYRGEGLLHFSGWYHAHNNIYAFAASLALEFERLFGDPQFREIAVGNLQWVAGLNCGLKEPESSRYLSVSMISGVGTRYRGSWTKIAGSICNGFSASKQFHVEPPRAISDRPTYFDDEAYIAHSLPFLSALARLMTYRPADGNGGRHAPAGAVNQAAEPPRLQNDPP